MAKFISISGPSSTGKTTIMDSLKKRPELSGAIFSPDLFNYVWSDLVEKKIFSNYAEIIKDSEYICVYILRLLEYYEDYITSYENKDKLILLDCCWLDLSVYTIVNLWYNRILGDLQEEILIRINNMHDTVDRIYLTTYDETKQIKVKYRSDFKIYSSKSSRPLELQYYDMMKNFKVSCGLSITDTEKAVDFIIDDIMKLGYLQ